MDTSPLTFSQVGKKYSTTILRAMVMTSERENKRNARTRQEATGGWCAL